MKMKNQYEIKESFLIRLENDELKERIKELKIKILELETKLKEVLPKEYMIQNREKISIQNGINRLSSRTTKYEIFWLFDT